MNLSEIYIPHSDMSLAYVLIIDIIGGLESIKATNTVTRV